jgi:hypothetical protein
VPETTQCEVRCGRHSPEETLREYARLLTPALDLSAAKDWAKCHATADVVVADETILEDGPVTYLLSLEHQLTEVLGFMRALQLTDPAEDWVWDENDACWRSRNPSSGCGWRRA